MKRTKTLLIGLAVLFITWVVLTFFIWFFFTNQMSYLEVFSDSAMIIFMSLFGWIPAVIIAAEYYEEYESLSHI